MPKECSAVVAAVTELAYLIKRDPDSLKVGGDGRAVITRVRELAHGNMTTAQRQQALQNCRRYDDAAFKQAMFFCLTPELRL